MAPEPHSGVCQTVIRLQQLFHFGECFIAPLQTKVRESVKINWIKYICIFLSLLSTVNKTTLIKLMNHAARSLLSCYI